MKIITLYLLLAILLQPLAVAYASSRRDTVRGALVGAATGALVSEFSSDISSRTAVPLFAGIGALSGYSLHHHRHRDYYGYHPDWQLTYGIHPYYHPVGYRQRWNRQFRPAPTPVRIAPVIRAIQNTQAATATRANRHPGVTRIPISFTTPSGFPLTITITKVGNQYVGPRGETYTEMPTVEQLQDIYRP